MLVIFLFDFDCGSKCLPTPFPALAFCLTIANTWAPRPYKQQGEQNRSGFKARSCLALPLLLVAPQPLLCQGGSVRGGRIPTVHHFSPSDTSGRQQQRFP